MIGNWHTVITIFSHSPLSSLVRIIFFTSTLYVQQNTYANSSHFIKLNHHGEIIWRMGLNCWSTYFNVFTRFLSHSKIQPKIIQ